jgi:PTS system beta-glucosides-specific IIC component
MAQSIRDYEKLAVDIVDAVGGKENIVNATRCATRLRLVLKETPKELLKPIEKRIANDMESK